MAERRRRVSSLEWSTAVIAGISLISGAIVFLRDGDARFTAILTNDLGLFGSMLPKMMAGCLVSAFMTRLLPREVVARLVGAESGLLGLLIATLMGAALPGGPLTIYRSRAPSWPWAPMPARRSPSSPPGTCSATIAR
jgi:uncharacterized membrane protein YraQ (UPF0718 family)